MFNAPYLPEDEGVDDKSIYGGKKGFEIIENFIKDAPNYLKHNGKILLVFSSLSGDVDKIIYENLLDYKIVDQKKLFFETLYLYCIKLSEVRKLVSNPRLHARGKRGLVFRAKYKDRDVAVKVKNPKTKAQNVLMHEARILKKVNRYGIGPKIILKEKNFIIMEFADGEAIESFIKEKGKLEIKKVIEDVFQQCFTLDQIGINKEEMHRPYKHIIIGKKTVLVDFERARIKENTHNVTQFCNFVSILLDIQITRLAEKYSKHKTKENLSLIMKKIKN
jgi:putative serine/threonine protein kinase